MTFTRQLYQHINDVLPGTTTRTFSHYCGRSEGYYGSITAQNLPISTNSLIYLAEFLDQIIAIKSNYQPHKAKQLREIQEAIADEIAYRTNNVPISNLPVRKMILGAVACVAYKRDHQFAMPTVILG